MVLAMGYIPASTSSLPLFLLDEFFVFCFFAGLAAVELERDGGLG